MFRPRYVELMGNSRPSTPKNTLELENSESREASLTPISSTDVEKPIRSYLVEKEGKKLLIAVFNDRIEAIGVNSKHKEVYRVQIATISTSTLYNYSTDPFLLVAISAPHHLLKFELIPLFPLDCEIPPARELFQAPVKFPFQVHVTLLHFCDSEMLVVGHELGYSLICFDGTYSSYEIQFNCLNKEPVTAVTSSLKVKKTVIATKNHLTLLSNKESSLLSIEDFTLHDLPTPAKTAVSLAIYHQLNLLFVLARNDTSTKQYIQIWDLADEALLCEKHITRKFKVTEMLIKPCLKTVGVISILLFSESNCVYVLEYSPLSVHLFATFKLHLDLNCGTLVSSYLRDGECYLLTPSLYSLTPTAFLPHHQHAFWTIPIIASSSDMDLRADVETQRRQARGPNLGLSEALETMVNMRPGSAAMSRADTNITR